MQQTLKNSITATDIGLHSGQDITMTLRPAEAGRGIVFVRVDVTDKNNVVPALWNNVVDTQLCTVIGNDAGVTIGTVEHLMAALRGCNIDNVLVELDGSEVPAMDGSSAPFVQLIEQAGIAQQSAPRRVIKVLKEIRIEEDGKWASLKPASNSVFAGEINFDHPQIGAQSMEIQLVNGNFKHDLANCRTFGFLHEVEYMRSNGLALGGSLDNAIVLDQDKVMNLDGLRREDEFIRHKLLDAVGDIYLAGGHIIGAYDSAKPGHALNNNLLKALFADPDAWTYEDVYIDMDAIHSGEYMKAHAKPAEHISA